MVKFEALLENNEVVTIYQQKVYTGCLKNLCPVCVATLEKLYIQLSWILHSCIGQTST